MAGGTNTAFGAGQHHAANTGRANDNSVTLGGSLQADSARWDAESRQAATSPHSVLSTYSFAKSANGTDNSHFVRGIGYMGSGKGMSDSDYDKSLRLRMAGGVA